MNCSLVELFTLLDVSENPEDSLFSDCENPNETTENFNSGSLNLAADNAIISGLYSPGRVDFLALPQQAQRLFELSIDAFKSLVHAWMSELSVMENVIRFGRKVLNCQTRPEADRAATDRGDPDVKLVLDISYRVWHEINRMYGLLRFSPNDDGLYTAYCCPDYFILPALAQHFTLRFGDCPWAIIDEKRGLCLSRHAGAAPVLGSVQSKHNQPSSDEWQQLWQHYHKTINNEGRNNPNLQRSFMPKRYWKHLPEISPDKTIKK